MNPKKNEPIAIIGLGCRFPGSSNCPQEFWNLLSQGKDAITEVPADRWNVENYYSPNPKAPGKMTTRWGGFIDSMKEFDARFFEISPREAIQMDPQQRILLECVWQALEDGGQVPERLAGTPVGVFLGVSGWEYQSYLKLDLHAIEGQTVSGVALSVGANRISYIFDFKGPSLITDTACSSSLVAAHLACQSIWNGESTMAITGGVNAILVPDVTVGLGKGGMLSPDGRCKSFDAAGNGYVRGEGAGIAVLKPLSKALADKDPVYALILSSTSNQDGRTWAMPVPNGESQKTLLRKGCATAGISPRQIQYLEAHGTGTPLGDPIEANAQGEVLSENRPADDVCYMGSVKSNIGHLESASGIAGLMKVVLALKNKQIPPNLHFNQPHPEIDFEKLQLQVPKELIPWPETDSPALASINSFGFGGTNANLILQEFPRPDDSSLPENRSTGDAFFCLPVSARSQDALKDFARLYLDFFSAKDDWAASDLQDVCYTASLRRSHHDHRFAITGPSVQELKEGLQAFLNDDKHHGLSAGKKIAVDKSGKEKPKIAFVFSGQGPQWWAMGRQLAEQEPVFCATLKKCDELFSQHADWSLWEELMAQESRSKINETHLTQPALFSIQVALADLWRSWGIEPSAVIGHSIGEAAAAYVAGIYSLEDAARIVYHRGRWLHKMAGKGKMAVVGIPEGKAESMLKDWGSQISLAAVNSPKSVTVSGDPDALEKLMAPLAEKEIFCRYLHVNYAFHSHQMDLVREDLMQSLNGLKCQSGTIPFYSTVRGKSECGDQMGADYWWDNVRNPVRFFKATEELVQDGFTTFLELSPHPVLGANISECLSHLKRQGTVLPSLKHKEDDRKVMVTSLSNLYSLGRSIDWNPVFPDGGRCVSLPYYPWQREPYWHEREEKGYDPFAPDVHPFLGWEMEFSTSGWQTRIDKRDLTYLGDHIVKKLLIFPGAGFIEWALALASRVDEGASCVLESVEFQNALVLPKNRGLKTQMTHDPADGSFKIHSLSDRVNQTWTLHASGKLGDLFEQNDLKLIDLEKIKNRCPHEVDSKELYETFEKMGLFYGPAFQGIEQSFRGEGEALALLKSPKALGLNVKPYQIHPAILDAAFQVSALLALESEALAQKLFLPVSVDRFQFNGSTDGPLWVHVQAVNFDSSQAVVDLTMFDDTGKIWVECQGLHFRALNPSRGRDLQDPDNWLYHWRWEPCVENGPEAKISDAALLPGPDQITSFLEKNLDDLAPVLNLSRFYDSIEPKLNQLSVSYVLSVLKNLTPGFESLTEFSTESFIAQFKLNPKHPAYLDNCFAMLANEGILKQENSQWKMGACPTETETPQEIWKSLIGEFPSYLAELNLLRLAGENLRDILTGESAGLETIFPEQDAVLERLHQSATSARIYNFQLQKMVSFLLGHLPTGRKLRVLAIGGGGTAASGFLGHCPPDRVEYLHTESSEEKLEKAVQKLREFSFVEFKTLDLQVPLSDQEFVSHSFDLVIGARLGSRLNFGATKNALENIRELLASDGLLLEIDWSSTSNWLRLILGSCEQAQYGDHDFSKELQGAGFQTISEWKDQPEGNSLQTFLLARSPKVSAENSSQEIKIPRPNKRGSWVIFNDGKGVGQTLAESLKNLGENCFLVTPGEKFDAK
ncbi:Polyketide synthase modules and related proteins, partial [hydrothermal vent metagenome]